MNFLGHLYFSNNNHTLMLANLYGDFVKGSDYTHLPPIVQKGVEIHRSIDYFTDNHPKVKELLHLLYPQLPKVSGIAVDLFFDHLLAKKWRNYHSLSLENFTQEFFKFAKDEENHFFLKPTLFEYPEDFINLIHLMDDRNWLLSYQELAGLNKACQGVSKRISFENVLPNCMPVFEKNEDVITLTFNQFMLDAVKKFNR